jgi:hypothetical protein
MKTASMVLGIVGGALLIIYMLFSAFIMFSITSIFEDEYYYEDDDYENMLSREIDGHEDAESLSVISDPAFAPLFFLGITGLISGGLGITGGILVRSRNTAAGILLIVAAVTSLSFFLSTICFILAAIFAFVREKPKPAYPPYGYYPYPYPYYYPPYGAPSYPPAPYPGGVPAPDPEAGTSDKPQG